MTAVQLSAIERHGRNLLAIFPEATERDPVKLCRKLRRIEARGAAFAMRLCNGPEYDSEEAADRVAAGIMAEVGKLLQFQSVGVPVFLNRDPRGYALKISDEYVSKHGLRIHTDWGGYGILAPEINAKG